MTEDTRPIGLMPPSFPPDYVTGSVVPFFLASSYIGETPLHPMIDLSFSKEKAAPVHFWGMLYEGWIPKPKEEGYSVFIQGYEWRRHSASRAS